MGIGGEEEEAECIRAELLLFFFLARSHSLRHLRCSQESRAADFPDKPGVRRPADLLSHFFEVADRLVSFSAGDFLYISPELAAG